jgi:hypothetical protein
MASQTVEGLVVGVLAIAVGAGVIACGKAIGSRSDQIYRRLQRLFGQVSYPDAGTKADNYRGFLSGYGIAVRIIGIAMVVMGVIKAVTAVIASLR